MKKLNYLFVFGIIIIFFLPGVAIAQPINLVEKKEVYDKEHIPKKNPIPYPNVREADVMWEKTVWRMINLREKMNHPIYFPTVPEGIGNRKSLFALLMDVLENPDPEYPVYAYSTLTPNYEFEQILDISQIHATLEFDTIKQPVIDSITGEPIIDPATGKMIMKVTGVQRNYTEISRLLVKEKWYFDRKYSSLQVRIIGLCPIKVFPEVLRDETTGFEEPTGNILTQFLFWIYYPDVRYYLTRQETFNPKNDAQRISFDDLFMQRRFSSYIYKQSNTFDNRQIKAYAKGMDAMFESERIRQDVFEFEHDLWEY